VPDAPAGDGAPAGDAVPLVDPVDLVDPVAPVDPVVAGGVEVPAVVGGVTVDGSDAAAASEPDGWRAAELVPPSHAVATSASTPRRPPTSRIRPRRWRLPRDAIDSIPVLVVPGARRGLAAGRMLR